MPARPRCDQCADEQRALARRSATRALVALAVALVSAFFFVTFRVWVLRRAEQIDAIAAQIDAHHPQAPVGPGLLTRAERQHAHVLSLRRTAAAWTAFTRVAAVLSLALAVRSLAAALTARHMRRPADVQALPPGAAYRDRELACGRHGG